MKQSKITITDRFIYGYINSYTINNKPVFASNKHIAEKIERSESVVSHSISRLLSNGFLINKGNKYARQLYTNIELINADFNSSIAENNKSNAENSISLEEFKRVIAENSNNEKLKTAITNAENSNILYKILISYTNIKEKTPKKIIKPSLDDVKQYAIEKNRLDLAQKFFDYYDTGDWKDKDGKQVKNWKQKFITWINRNEVSNDPSIQLKTSQSAYINRTGATPISEYMDND